MSQVRTHINCRVSNAAIRKATRNGRDVLILPSVVGRFDTVLNDINYAKDEWLKSYESLDRTPAPLGHPKVNGNYVSASDPEAINAYWSGAWNESPHIQGDKIRSDVIVDVERAKQHKDGQRLLDTIESGGAINTSTGLLLNKVPAVNKDYAYEGTNFVWDHVALLLDEPPAIGVEEGVGLMLNGEQVEVQNADLEYDPMEDAISMMAWTLVDAQEHKERKGIVETVKTKLRDVLKSMVNLEPEATGLETNSNEEGEMSEERLKALETRLDALVQTNADQKPVAEQVTEAMKPLMDQLQANAEAAKAAETAKHDAAVKAVVDAEILDEETAKGLDVNALTKLAEKYAKPGAAMGVNGAMPKAAQGDVTSAYSLPEGE